MSKDSPALAYSLQDVLRQMFKCGADLLLYKDGRGNLIIEKDRIIVQLGRKDDLTLRELIANISSEDKGAFKKSLPPGEPFNKTQNQRVLCVTPDGFADSTLDVLRQTSNPALGLPVWWDVPIPILSFFNDEIKLNDCGCAILSSPQDIDAVKNYLTNFTKNNRHDGDALEISLNDKALLLHNIGEGYYRIEDISPDFDMAQELAWWAAVGYSLSERLTQSGAAIERIRPEDAKNKILNKKTPKNQKTFNAGEDTIKLLLGDVPCLWDGELLGYMRIALQEQEIKTKRARVNKNDEHSDISELLGILEGE